MNRFASLLWLLLLLPATASAGLYEDTKTLVEKELSTAEVEDYLAAYIAAVFQPTYPGITPGHVQRSIESDWPGLCDKIDKGNLDLNRVDCAALQQRVKNLITNEQRVRSLGRKLQSIATGYEIALSELPDGTLRLPVEFAGIANMWGTGTGAVKQLSGSGVLTGSGHNIRTRILTQSEQNAVQPHINRLSAALEALDEEQRTAAAWRYRYGYRFIGNERSPSFSPPVYSQADKGTERQFLNKRWQDVERALEAIWDSLPITFDPPLARGEAAYFLIKAELPSGITLWARTDGESNQHPLGDVGLQFKFPLEPVLPSLLPDGYMKCLENGGSPATCASLGQAILGGTYPPAPVPETDDVGLCSQPVGLRGYLCRPIQETAERPCSDEDDDDPNTIKLTTCGNIDLFPRYSAAGPGVCRELEWRSEPGNLFREAVEDPQRQCAVTRVDIRCGDCGPTQALTEAKQANGHISICLGPSPLPATYYLLHELTHASQQCGKPVGDNPYAAIDADASLDINQKNRKKVGTCCQLEGEGYRVQCDAMERDGGFLDADGNPIVINGITMNAETCAELYTDYSCKERFGGGCFPTRDYGSMQTMFSSITTMESMVAAAVQGEVAATCEEAKALTTADLRVVSKLQELQPGYDVCTPLNESEYANRIGNNLCYIGQCAEQSLEEYRIQGGMIPNGAGAESFPWDAPLAYSPKATLVLDPPSSRASFPAYNPRLIAQKMDLALCQLVGLPSMTPPVLCAISENQRLTSPLIDPLLTVQSLLQQQQSQTDETAAALTGLSGYGARIGADLYGHYLREAVRSLAGMLDIANQLFDDIESIDFPSEMCPVDSRLPTAATPS